MVQQCDGFDVLSRSSDDGDGGGDGGEGDGGDGDGRKWKWWKLEPRSSPVPLEQAAFVLQTLGLRINIQTQFSFIDANAATLFRPHLLFLPTNSIPPSKLYDEEFFRSLPFFHVLYKCIYYNVDSTKHWLCSYLRHFCLFAFRKRSAGFHIEVSWLAVFWQQTSQLSAPDFW